MKLLIPNSPFVIDDRMNFTLRFYSDTYRHSTLTIQSLFTAFILQARSSPYLLYRLNL